MATIQPAEMTSGPLKLEHDLTPRDVGYFNRTVDDSLSRADFRYRGFPDGNFERSKRPIGVDTRSQSDSYLSNPYYGLNHYFDKKQPAVNGESEGLQYGSQQVLTSKENRVPLRTPRDRVSSQDQDRTSGQLRKYKRQEEEVHAQIAQYREEKMKQLKMLEDTKKKDLEMLKSYNPWGKPGGGAPRGSANEEHHKKKFTEYDAPDTQRSDPPRDYLEEYGDFHQQFGRPGGGAPIRTDSGKVKPELKVDPLIRFQDTQKAQRVMDTDIRYRKPLDEQHFYSDHLEKQISDRRSLEERQREQDREKDMETLRHDPFGKPGAGAPNTRRPADGSVANGKENFDYFDPWGKGYGAPRYDRHGDVRRHPNLQVDKEMYTTDRPALTKPQDDEGVTLPFISPRGGGGAPVKTDSGHVVARHPITMKKGDYGDSSIREELPNRPIKNWSKDPDEQIYDPWGRPGAGAPLKDDKGDVKTALLAQVERKNSTDTKERKQKYLEELRNGIKQQEKNRQQQEYEMKHGADELASIMKRGQVGRPRLDPYTGELANQHLSSTDVSQEKSPRRAVPGESQQYHTELERAAHERRRLIELEKMKDKQEARHHDSEMSSFWGRPGGGAPNPAGVKMANIENSLHAPRGQPQQYVKRYLDGESPHPYGNYTKNTVHSTANNGYEFLVDNKRTHKVPYQLVSPYSTEQQTSMF